MSQLQKEILIAEDNRLNYVIIRKLIQSIIDVPVAHAENGQEAVEYCKENPDIQLVLMDIKMPVMDGYEATRRIKQLNPSLPVIAQTAFIETESREEAIEAGCDDYLTKPIKKDKLLRILETFMKREQ